MHVMLCLCSVLPVGLCQGRGAMPYWPYKVPGSWITRGVIHCDKQITQLRSTWLVPLIRARPVWNRPHLPAQPMRLSSSCLHRGHHGGKEMVRCLHCAIWMHADCIAKREEYYPSSWVCFTCRQIPSQVTTLTRDMARLVEMVQGLTSSMTRLKDQHERAMAQADEQHQKLATENAELRQRISDLSRQASGDHWRQLKKPHGTALIGSSIIRDIAEEKLVATQCICKRGGARGSWRPFPGHASLPHHSCRRREWLWYRWGWPWCVRDHCPIQRPSGVCQDEGNKCHYLWRLSSHQVRYSKPTHRVAQCRA